MTNNPKSLKLAQIILSKVGVCDYWKLLKLMYFIDFESYFVTGKPITESVYYHLPYGPVPDNYKNDLINKGETEGLWEVFGNHNIILLQKEGLGANNFTKIEYVIIELILGKYGNLSGKELIALSHDDPPWYLTSANDIIDYELVKWRDSEITESEDITKKILDA